MVGKFLDAANVLEVVPVALVCRGHIKVLKAVSDGRFGVECRLASAMSHCCEKSTRESRYGR